MIKLADVFQNGLTLQREKEIAVWGVTNQKQEIQVYLDGQLMVQGEFQLGKFNMMIPPQKAGENHTIKVVGSTGDSCELINVDIGEVWIAGGQSNMEFLMRYELYFKMELAEANDPHLRFYDVPKYAFEGEEKDGFKKKLGYGVWRSCNRKELGYFSAVGYYFAKQLREKYHIPVAIVSCNWGGTSASAWLDEKILQNSPSLSVYWNEYQEGLKQIDFKTYDEENRKNRKLEENIFAKYVSSKLLDGTIGPHLMAIVRKYSAGSLPIIGPHSQFRPGGLYHSMLKKIMGYSCRGIIWYQGESDDTKADIYGELFTSVIKCWRDGWKEELPFLFVQLAPYGEWMGGTGDKYPMIRAQQELVSKKVANTAMASIMDIGMEKDIHPKNKKGVGERLALLARAKVYGEQILCESPEAIHAKHEDDRIEIQFLNSGTGLKMKGTVLNALTVVSGDQTCRISQINVENDRLILKSEDFKNKDNLAVHFADVAYCEVNLFNSIGLPAKPFILKI